MRLSAHETVTVVLAQAPPPADPGGQGEDFGKSSPVGLVLLILFGIAVAFLIRSMTKHLKKVPASFEAGPTSSSSADSSSADAGGSDDSGGAGRDSDGAGAPKVPEGPTGSEEPGGPEESSGPERTSAAVDSGGSELESESGAQETGAPDDGTSEAQASDTSGAQSGEPTTK